MNQFPDGLGVRIPDSHSGGPGSIPGQGALFMILLISSADDRLIFTVTFGYFYGKPGVLVDFTS